MSSEQTNERDELRKVIASDDYNLDSIEDEITDAVLEWLHTAGYRKPVAVEGDAGELSAWNNTRSMKYSDDAAEAWRTGTSGTYARMLEDLSANHSATADLIESQQQRIRELEAELKAAYASETYEQRRAEQADATIARVREATEHVVYLKTVRNGWVEEDYSRPLLEANAVKAALDASPEKGGQD